MMVVLPYLQKFIEFANVVIANPNPNPKCEALNETRNVRTVTPLGVWITLSWVSGQPAGTNFIG